MKSLFKLKPKVKLQTDFFVFDTETGTRETLPGGGDKITWQLNARPESFIFGVIYGLNFTKIIHDRDEMVNEFKDPRYKNKKVFAHNFGGYDGSVLFGNIFDLDPGAIFVGSKFIACTNGNCLFADSLNIYATSIKKIGQLLKLDKIGMDGGNYESSIWPEDKARDINGCIRDCEIIYEALFRIFSDAGDIKITQASLAMTFYRRFHQPFTIEHDPALNKHFFSSYFGGRTEVFKLGQTHAKVIDVNSMYPAVMKSEKFPNPKFLKEESINVKTDYFLHCILPHYEGCIYCTVNHPELFLGLLPTKINGKLCFPVGVFSGCWNFNELRYAISQGVIVKNITRIVYADRMPSPFEDFVDTLYLQRTASESDFEKYRIKIFMNSLYGKFAQRITEETIYIKDIEKQIDEIQAYQKAGTFIKLMTFNTDRLDAFLVIKATKKIDISYSIPSFASYITSAARVLLAKKLIEFRNNKIVYCDTDSIFYELEPVPVESETFLGGWKVEDKIITEINGLKNYKFIKDGKHFERIKGVPTTAVKVGPVEFEYSNLLKSKESLRRNLAPGVLTKRTKKMTNRYSKRTVLDNGETNPIKL